MTKIERKFFDFIQKHIIVILYAAVTVLGLFLRIFGMEVESDDYQSFLNPWWMQIEDQDITGLARQVGNYNIPYQILIFIFTRLQLGPLVSYKLISIVFDFVLAISAALLVNSFVKSKSQLKTLLVYSLVFCSLTVIFNSAFWAQCDSIYVSFILLALYFIKKDKNILAFVMLGISLGFKLQVIFIIPFFLFYYVCERKISILHFLIIPAVDILMCLPAVFLGRNFSDIFTIYVAQTDYGKLIQMNFPNMWAFICQGANTENYVLFKTFSIVLTAIILGVALGALMYKKVKLDSYEKFLLTAVWSVFTCLMFLSSMHERYAYLLDVLVLLYAVAARKHYWLPVACQLVSLRGYCSYLFSFSVISFETTAVIYVLIYAFVSYLFAKDVVFAPTSEETDEAFVEEKVEDYVSAEQNIKEAVTYENDNKDEWKDDEWEDDEWGYDEVDQILNEVKSMS